MAEIKLVIAIPSSGTNPFAFTISLASLTAYLAGGIRSRPGVEFDVILDGQTSSTIHANREKLVERAIEGGRTHLLFLDHDMRFDPRAVDLLFSRRHPAVATNYLIKRQPPETPDFVAVSLDGRRVATTPEKTGIQEVAYTGFGVSLFEVEAVKKLPRPWFCPRFCQDGFGAGHYTTEDNPFYEALRTAGYTCYVDHDASKLVGHVGDYEWRWDRDWQKQVYSVDTSVLPPAESPVPVNRLAEGNGKPSRNGKRKAVPDGH